jgi:hypothetical protein
MQPGRRRPGGGGGRDITLYLGSDDPVKLLFEPPTRSRRRWRRCPSSRAARPGRSRPARDHHHAALDLAADLGVTTRRWPDDPHRDDRRHRPEQRQILAADRQVPIRVVSCPNRAARPVDAREPAGADRERRLGAAEVGRRDQLRLGPDTVQRTNQVRRIAVGADLAPGWSAATPGRRSTSCRP